MEDSENGGGSEDVAGSEVSFLGGVPPVTVSATNGANVEVNYTVRIVVEVRMPDSLRKWSDNISNLAISAMVAGGL